MKPTILIEDDVYRKVMHFVNKSKDEVSGLGMVRVEKDGVLRVVSTILLPQKNGSTHTDIEAEDVNKALYKLRESEGDLRWWWHSHVMMGVFWSETDHDTIKKIGAGGWMAATVFNQKKEVKSCYYGAHGQQTPWGTESLFLDDLTTKVSVPLEPNATLWDEEYDRNVTARKPVWTVGEYNAGKYGSGATNQNGNKSGSADFDPKVSPPVQRPIGMSKKTFKKWNTAHVNFIAGLRAIGGNTFDMRTDPESPAKPNTIKVVQSDKDTDEYGFDQEERTLLATNGWSITDVDDLLEEDFSPTEMLRLARLGVAPTEVEYLLKHCNYKNDDVMGLVDQSEAFGQNLFEGANIWRSYGGVCE